MICMKNISKIYGKGDISVKALQDVNISIDKGEFISIVGQSGSGKSTLMNLIGCLDSATDGEYTLDGNSTQKMNKKELAKIRNEKIGFVFQSFNLIAQLDALKNVELPLIYAGVPYSKRKKIAKEMLEKVGLGDRMHHKPNELSGGQKQRVAIARALVNKPALILADEPTGNLDTATTREILQMLTKLNDEGTTIVIVTHESEVAAITKRSLRFADGYLIEDKEVV
ncbi:MAG: macrolide ABC transporter ATP-binding protein [Alkaliphilus sp.]|nr:MAG: macrolide ABC transporter ATP-binding protein [Alkaliphilus sp.]